MNSTDNGKRKVGVFDIRFVIGGLIGLSAPGERVKIA